jgi:hypothetical protein
MNNKRNSVLIIAVAAVVIIGGIFLYFKKSASCDSNLLITNKSTVDLDKSNVELPSGSFVVYDKDGVKVIEDKQIQYNTDGAEVFTPTVNVPDAYIVDHVYDNSSEIATLISDQIGAGTTVDAVNSDYIFTHVVRDNGATADAYVINRQTHDVTHYWLPYLSQTAGKEFLAFTSDAKELVFDDKTNVIVLDSSLKEIQRAKIAPTPLISRADASMSPDDNHLAIISSENYLNSENPPKYAVYVYDLKKNVITKIQDVPDSGKLVWKDNSTFVNMVIKGTSDKAVESETFTVGK